MDPIGQNHLLQTATDDLTFNMKFKCVWVCLFTNNTHCNINVFTIAPIHLAHTSQWLTDACFPIITKWKTCVICFIGFQFIIKTRKQSNPSWPVQSRQQTEVNDLTSAAKRSGIECEGNWWLWVFQRHLYLFHLTMLYAWN